jgi:hypothetical protein
MIRIGIVAEGPSDWLALEELIKAIHPDVDFIHLRPDMTLVSRSPHGWKGVKAWCKQEGARLEALLSGIQGYPIHLLVIHVDCSMAHNVGVLHPCPPARATADALREVLIQDWLGLGSLPGFVLLATPSRTTDAWIVAALEPPYSGSEPLECDDLAERELARRGLLPRKDGEVKKPHAKYRPLAEAMARALDRVCGICTEAERFREEFAAAVGRAEAT